MVVDSMEKHFYPITEIFIIFELAKTYMKIDQHNVSKNYLMPLNENIINYFEFDTSVIYPRVIVSITTVLLSECLLKLENYEEALVVLDKGILWDKSYCKTKFLLDMLFNKFRCLHYLEREEEQLELQPQVYYLALAQGRADILSGLKGIIKKNNCGGEN